MSAATNATREQQLLLQRAKAEGLLPADASWPAQPQQRPWPVVLLTAIGAWFAAVPLLLLATLLLGKVLMQGGGPYAVGAGVLALSVGLLRAAKLPLFIEQLAVPGLLVGGGLLGYALFRDLESRWAALPLFGLSLLIAALIDRSWLRVALGALAAVLAAQWLQPRWFNTGDTIGLTPWLTVQVLLGLWIAALVWQQGSGPAAGQARLAQFVESCGSGWLLATLVLLCWLAGTTMLVGGLVDARPGLVHPLRAPLPQALGSVLCALAAAAWLARTWPGLRRPWLAGVALVLVALACLMDTLGAALLALAVLCTSGRWRLAGAAAVAAVWIVGAFYYALAWPLADKALALASAGALLLVLAGWAGGPASTQNLARVMPGRAGWAIAAGTLLTLAVANGAIWQKQRLIAEGQRVFVALAPADPRSLMQGDFMRLNFALPREVSADLRPGAGRSRPRLVATLDQRGVARMLRLHDERQALAPAELLIELTPKNGGWIVVTDAWFFREGTAARYERARFGEFRVLPDGRALLVNLADEKLLRIGD